jgi:hypothetical protein
LRDVRWRLDGMGSNGAGRRGVGALVVRVGTRTGAGWWPEALLLGGFLVLTLALANGLLLDLDIAVGTGLTHTGHGCPISSRGA